MAAALEVLCKEIDWWSDLAHQRGSEIVALAVRGVAERIRASSTEQSNEHRENLDQHDSKSARDRA